MRNIAATTVRATEICVHFLDTCFSYPPAERRDLNPRGYNRRRMVRLTPTRGLLCEDRSCRYHASYRTLVLFSIT